MLNSLYTASFLAWNSYLTVLSLGNRKLIISLLLPAFIYDDTWSSVWSQWRQLWWFYSLVYFKDSGSFGYIRMDPPFAYAATRLALYLL